MPRAARWRRSSTTCPCRATSSARFSAFGPPRSRMQAASRSSFFPSDSPSRQPEAHKLKRVCAEVEFPACGDIREYPQGVALSSKCYGVVVEPWDGRRVGRRKLRTSDVIAARVDLERALPSRTPRYQVERHDDATRAASALLFVLKWTGGRLAASSHDRGNRLPRDGGHVFRDSLRRFRRRSHLHLYDLCV